MKTLIALILFLFFTTNIIQAQFTIELISEPLPLNEQTDGDTISLAINHNLVFEVYPIDEQGDTLQNVSYRWDFGDETIMDISLNTVQHVYTEAGGYYVVLKATDNDSDETIYKMIPVRVAKEPDFSETNAEMTNESICLGDKVTINGFSSAQEWELEADSVFDVNIGEIHESVTTESVVTIPQFSHDEKVEAEKGLKKVCMTFEHSNLGNLEISLVNPQNDTLVLKTKNETQLIFAGEPIISESEDFGNAYEYCWEMEGDELYTVMSDIAVEEHTINYSDALGNEYNAVSVMPKGSYLPHESFDKLIGSEILGDWKLILSASNQGENGYVEGWSMHWASDLFRKWKFENTYAATDTSWEGANAGKTTISDVDDKNQTGRCEVEPDEEGDNYYTYTVIDNWGYAHEYDDLSIKVTTPDFEFAGPEGTIYVGDEAIFTNLTEWSVHHYWDFGNRSKDTPDTEITNLYDENEGFEDKKKVYNVQLIAESEQGCKDTIVKEVTVELFDYKFENQTNVFTPNGDGANNKFKFKFENWGQFTDAEIHIYNRWGKKIWKSKDLNEIEDGWDGNSNVGQEAPAGSYYYFVKFKTRDRLWHEEKGNFYLYR